MVDLKNFITNNGVIQRGHFDLASGGTTDTYIDAKLITLAAAGLAASVPKLFRLLVSTAQFDAIGCLELGAVPIVGAMLMHVALSDDRPYKGFIVRKSAKGYGTNKLVEGPVKAGMRCAILEDVVNTGGSVMKTIEIVRNFGMKVVVVGAIINRQAGADELFETLKIPFVYLATKNQLI